MTRRPCKAVTRIVRIGSALACTLLGALLFFAGLQKVGAPHAQAHRLIALTGVSGRVAVRAVIAFGTIEVIAGAAAIARKWVGRRGVLVLLPLLAFVVHALRGVAGKATGCGFRGTSCWLRDVGQHAGIRA